MPRMRACTQVPMLKCICVFFQFFRASFQFAVGCIFCELFLLSFVARWLLELRHVTLSLDPVLVASAGAVVVMLYSSAPVLSLPSAVLQSTFFSMRFRIHFAFVPWCLLSSRWRFYCSPHRSTVTNDD